MSAIKEAQLAEIVGVTTARIRQLHGEGEIPSPVDGDYDTVPTLKALFVYYRKRASGAAADLKFQRARSEKRKADILDLDFEAKKKTLVDMATVQKFVADTWIPVVQAIRNLPSECAHRCNPTDPETGMLALERWVNTRFFPSVRAGMPPLANIQPPARLKPKARPKPKPKPAKTKNKKSPKRQKRP
jgi:hypothetical protein